MVNKENCTQETLDLSQFVFFPLGNKCAIETCPTLGATPWEKREQGEEMGNILLFLCIHMAQHRPDFCDGGSQEGYPR